MNLLVCVNKTSEEVKNTNMLSLQFLEKLRKYSLLRRNEVTARASEPMCSFTKR